MFRKILSGALDVATVATRTASRSTDWKPTRKQPPCARDNQATHIFKWGRCKWCGAVDPSEEEEISRSKSS